MAAPIALFELCSDQAGRSEAEFKTPRARARSTGFKVVRRSAGC